MFGNPRIQVLRQVEQNIYESETDSFRDMKSVNIVLPWLAATGTLRKEFEKNKLGNIPSSVELLCTID